MSTEYRIALFQPGRVLVYTEEDGYQDREAVWLDAVQLQLDQDAAAR